MGKKAKEIKPKKKFETWKKIIALVIAGGFLFYIIIFNFLIDKSDEKMADEYKFKKEGELVILDSLNNTKQKIDIEIADNDYERQLGLMMRNKMDENQGMLFIFPQERFQSFWMRNTLISLDMLFINADKVIVTIHKNTTPLSEQSYPSSEPAKYVLEVVSGFTDKYNIVKGDKINWIGNN